MGYVDTMSAGIQENETQQYCQFEEPSEKSQSSNSFMQFSPSTHDWTTNTNWDIKTESDSDSDSSQQIGSYCDERDANTENTPSTSCSLNFLDPSSSDEVASRKKKKCKEMPAVSKPAQVVERRNARERRRVQAVNGAFQKLRKVVPIEENKSKRMSKVKTLQLAIEYINNLQNQLQVNAQRSTHPNEASSALIALDVYADFNPQQQIKLESDFSPFRLTQYYYDDAE